MNKRSTWTGGAGYIIALLLVLIIPVVTACDDNNKPDCRDVPARMDDSFFENHAVTYFCELSGDPITYTLTSELTPGGAFCTLLYTDGDLNGFGPGSITFSGEIDDTGTLCDFSGTEALLVINLESEEGMVDTGDAQLVEMGVDSVLFLDADVEFTLIGEFMAPDLGCSCVNVD